MEGVGVTSAFWRGRRVCITGLTGFKGAWLGLLLKSFGAEVSGISLEPELNSMYKVLELERFFDSHIQNICDQQDLLERINELAPDTVFHLAAQSLVRESYKEPVKTLATNILGTAHVLEAIRLNKVVRSAVIVSSDKCYHNKKIQWAYTESDALGGHDPYSASKGACEIVAASYIDSFFRGSEKGIATARAGNVIGGGDFARDRIVPDCIQALQAERGLNLRFPFATRPWQHVLEPLSGYVLLAERLHQSPSKYSEAWNFGPRRGAEISVESLVKQLAKKWGFDLRVSTPNDPQPYEAQFLSLDCGKANERLGWFPRLSIEETLDWTVEWYKAFFDSKELALEVAQSQIERYEKIRVGA